MKLDFSIGIGQRQGLTLTAQVQQAIKLLQMTNLEVNEFIEENFAVNPFIELKDKVSRETTPNSGADKSETHPQQKHLKKGPSVQRLQKQKLS